MNDQDFVPSDEELMALVDGTADEELRRKAKDIPKIQQMVDDAKRLEDWLSGKLSKPSPEQITAYVLGELPDNERAYIELFMEIDEIYRTEVEASREFLMQEDPPLESNSHTPALIFKKTHSYIPAVIQRMPIASRLDVGFRQDENPIDTVGSEPIRVTAEGVEITFTVQTTPTQLVISGSVIAEDEDTWANSIIEVWHESNLIRVTRLADWIFRCEVSQVSPLEARVISSAGNQILIPLVNTKLDHST